MNEKVWIVFNPGYDQVADGNNQEHFLGVFDNELAAYATSAGEAGVMEVSVRSAPIPSQLWYKVTTDPKTGAEKTRRMVRVWEGQSPWFERIPTSVSWAYAFGYSVESHEHALKLARAAIAAQGE